MKTYFQPRSGAMRNTESHKQSQIALIYLDSIKTRRIDHEQLTWLESMKQSMSSAEKKLHTCLIKEIHNKAINIIHTKKVG